MCILGSQKAYTVHTINIKLLLEGAVVVFFFNAVPIFEYCSVFLLLLNVLLFLASSVVTISMVLAVCCIGHVGVGLSSITTYSFFALEAASPCVMVDGLLSWGSFHFHWGSCSSLVEVKATPGQKAIHHHTRT